MDFLVEFWLSLVLLVLFVTMFVRTLTGKGGSGCGRLAIGKMYKHLFRFAFSEGGWEIVYRYDKNMYLRRIGSFCRARGRQMYVCMYVCMYGHHI